MKERKRACGRFKIEKSKGKGLNVEGTGTARAPEKQKKHVSESRGIPRSKDVQIPKLLFACFFFMVFVYRFRVHF